MTKEIIFKIELQKEIADHSENTLMPTAKEIVKTYKKGFENMKVNQIESLANVARNTSELKHPGQTVKPFIDKQADKNRKDKADTWAFKPKDNPIELSAKVLQVVQLQKSQAKQFVGDLESDFSDILTGNKVKKKWITFTEIQLVKAFVFHLVSWYYGLEILPDLEEV